MRSFIALALSLIASSPVVASASDHPGNVYEAGDDVRVDVPAAWSEIAPGGREERVIENDGRSRKATARFHSEAGNAIVSGRVVEAAATVTVRKTPVGSCGGGFSRRLFRLIGGEEPGG